MNIGISAYFGKSQSTLYDGIVKNDEVALAAADSSVVGISMFGLDARYRFQGLQLRGQLLYTSLSNTDQYNVFTSPDGSTLNDLGSSMLGYYVETGYNVLRFADSKKQLIPFIRFEYLNTHHTVESGIAKNFGYEKTTIITGLTMKLSEGAVVKAEMQFLKSGDDDQYSNVFNAGFGVMF